MADAMTETAEGLKAGIMALGTLEIPIIQVLNKVDQVSTTILSDFKEAMPDVILMSAKNHDGLPELEKALLNIMGLDQANASGTLVTNIRHYQQLVQTQETLIGVLNALKSGLTGDLIAQDLRHALHHLGEITGQISNDDLLKNIFGKFCIGK